ncbi:MAG: DUF5668 domain-containing protein [Deltaproteobacteria bacterium]|nr:DUF5668 domain-containing protein [Deltaproteobacteria bacterium]
MFHMPCDHERHHSHHGGLFMGGTLIIMGTAFLLSRLGYLGGVNPWHFWPAILIWAGLLRVIGCRRSGSGWWGLVLMVVGGALEAHYLHVLPVALSTLWPVLLILLGVFVLFHGLARRRRPSFEGSTSERTLRTRIMFGGREERVSSRQWKGGVVDCTGGGLKLDLSDAEIEGEEARLDIDLVMGGIELRVPRHWKVVVEVSPVMGGVEDRSFFDGSLPGAKRLVIAGRVLMGGVEIKN